MIVLPLLSKKSMVMTNTLQKPSFFQGNFRYAPDAGNGLTFHPSMEHVITVHRRLERRRFRHRVRAGLICNFDLQFWNFAKKKGKKTRKKTNKTTTKTKTEQRKEKKYRMGVGEEESIKENLLHPEQPKLYRTRLHSERPKLYRTLLHSERKTL